MARTIETRQGSRVVVTIADDDAPHYSSRLYVNGGETATLTCAKHSTEAGARRWAAKILARAA